MTELVYHNGNGSNNFSYMNKAPQRETDTRASDTDSLIIDPALRKYAKASAHIQQRKKAVEDREKDFTFDEEERLEIEKSNKTPMHDI